MEKKMTSGEIAKKAGISQKAVRLYDEKGLLKPSDYSEGNYRLYDKEALQILEKIVALKQIGFSLEEIRDNISEGEAGNVEEALRMQLKTMEDKRYQIDKVIASINRTLERKADKLDWDDVAQIVQNVSIDQKADEWHWDALKHTSEDWHVTLFDTIKVRENDKVLDLGCGYGKIWRNNWKKIPKDTKVFGYDMHGSWADDFEKYISEHKDELADGTEFKIEFEDLTGEAAWKKIKKEKEYSLILAHYLYFEIKNIEDIVARASKVLSKDGVFSYNGYDVNWWYVYFINDFKEMGLDTSFIEEGIREQKAAHDSTEAMLKKYFSNVEAVELTNTWHYTDPEEIIDKMSENFADHRKYILDNKKKITEFYAKKLKKYGELVFRRVSVFWNCKC
ncbi:MAG: MerR family transcriptional regulator [Lachnospiraceae bacterium]|nr:MerR family transcriptional regulator [Lachnospiraceae bacterium]